MLSLDEAITHAREKAEKMYLQGMLCHANPNDDELDGCIECAKEHEQLAEWLEELKSYRLHIFSGDMTKKMLKEEYIKAIDDFVKEICKMIVQSENNGNHRFYAVEIKQAIADLAERLKAGGRE